MKKIQFYPWTTVLAAIIIMSGCNRHFDIPPTNADPEINATLSISELKSRYKAIGDFQRITADEVISGIVIADDRSGNFYKQIVIQDETGGIPVLLDANNVYTQYPVGRRVFILLNGMMLGDYGGTIQIGLDSSRSEDGRFLNLDGIPQALFDQYLVKGSFNNTVIPKIVKPAAFTKNINDPLLSTLVQIEQAEFRDADIHKTYADPSTNVSAVNFTIATCDKQSILLRNSSYARFAAFNVPDGNGTITGIPGIFNGTPQLFIRDTSDVQFAGTRCSGQATTPVFKTIAELKGYATADSLIPLGVYISGVVVSGTQNEAAANYRLQDASAGIQLRFNTAANPNAATGDSLTVTVGGLSLSTFNGGLQVSNINQAVKTGAGMVEPKRATIAAIIANSRAWESTVVTIDNVTIEVATTSGTGTNYLVSDATGQLTSFVRSTAGITMPAAAGSITGYISLFQPAGAGSQPETQLILRHQADISGGRGGYFSARYDFSSVTSVSGTTDPGEAPAVEGLLFGSFTATGVSSNSSASGRFSFSSWPTGATDGINTFTGTVNTGKYYEVTVTPAAGIQWDLAKISFTLQRSGTGVRQVAVRAVSDNYSTNLTAAIEPANANLSIADNHVFQVSDAATTPQEGCTVLPGAGFKNISSAVTIRFYGFNAESTGGTFSIDNVKIEGVVR